MQATALRIHAFGPLTDPNNLSLDEITLPGPTGESNVLRYHPRGTLLCLGPTDADVRRQIEMAEATGNRVRTAESKQALEQLLAAGDFDAVACFGPPEVLSAVRQSLSQRTGAIVPLITSPCETFRLIIERHVCIDTTAAGGNASLLAEAEAGRIGE